MKHRNQSLLCIFIKPGWRTKISIDFPRKCDRHKSVLVRVRKKNDWQNFCCEFDSELVNWRRNFFTCKTNNPLFNVQNKFNMRWFSKTICLVFDTSQFTNFGVFFVIQSRICYRKTYTQYIRRHAANTRNAARVYRFLYGDCTQKVIVGLSRICAVRIL